MSDSEIEFYKILVSLIKSNDTNNNDKHFKGLE